MAYVIQHHIDLFVTRKSQTVLHQYQSHNLVCHQAFVTSKTSATTYDKNSVFATIYSVNNNSVNVYNIPHAFINVECTDYGKIHFSSQRKITQFFSFKLIGFWCFLSLSTVRKYLQLRQELCSGHFISFFISILPYGTSISLFGWNNTLSFIFPYKTTGLNLTWASTASNLHSFG